MGKVADHHDPAVRLDGDGVDDEICAGADVKILIQTAVAVQPGQAAAVVAIIRGEVAADEHPTVGLQHHGLHRVVRAAAGVERTVERPVVVQPGDAVPVLAIHRGEESGQNGAAIRLDSDGTNGLVHPLAKRKSGVDGSVRVQPGQAVTEQAVHLCEIAADHKLAVPQQGDHIDKIVGPSAGIECGVHRAGRLVDGLVVDHREGGHVRRAEDGFLPAAAIR